MLRLGELQLLVSCLHGGNVIVLQVERCAIQRVLGVDIPAAQVEPGGHAQIPGEAILGCAVEADSTLAPSARDDEGLHEVALYAVEVGGLVVLVEHSERHEEKAAFDGGPVSQLAVDVELL